MCDNLEPVPTARKQLSRQGMAWSLNSARSVPGAPCDNPAGGLLSRRLDSGLWLSGLCRTSNDGTGWTRRDPTWTSLLLRHTNWRTERWNWSSVETHRTTTSDAAAAVRRCRRWRWECNATLLEYLMVAWEWCSQPSGMVAPGCRWMMVDGGRQEPPAVTSLVMLPWLPPSLPIEAARDATSSPASSPSGVTWSLAWSSVVRSNYRQRGATYTGALHTRF
ncbi:hypothetical protein CPLU01_00669 [Colletotrichum plurivorum]|uniref:Uncharacterized protein n=1 Tax=Colletotrichum plurivorum TaxID=2175906 RepID=A0A8H6U584_9PEZI|nr:hypothetical protein CPLU01_00669 [Colletotrichum plurivorum]